MVFGGGNYSALLPPNSFVDARKFSSPGGFFKKLNNPIKRQFGPNLIQIFSVFLLYWSDLNESSNISKHTYHINPTELAGYLGKILASPNLWNSYFDWRPHYDITRWAKISKVSNMQLIYNFFAVLPRCLTIVPCATSSRAESLGSPISMRISSHG